MATPGCYVTAATLALAPLLDAGLVASDGIIVDAASGVSGAGRATTATNAFCTVDEDFVAYGLLDHRHTPEIEQNLSAQVLFTPHLAPMNRGILATCYARPSAGAELSTDVLLAELRRAYDDEPFVVVHRRVAVDEGDARLERRPRHGSLRRPHGDRHRAVRARQPDEGRLRRRPAVRQRRPRPRRNPRPPPGRSRSVTVTDERTIAHVLVEALPYIRRFAGKTVVVKYGGNALAGTSDHDALDLFAQDVVLMRLVGMRPVVVHGGGPQISALMQRLGKTAEFRDGLRVTDAETVDIARMVLDRAGQPAARDGDQPARRLRRRRQRRGRRARSAPLPRDPELGFVGDVTSINPAILDGLLADEFIPVVATIGTDDRGQAYNINADVVAGAIAEALGAEKLVYLTDIEGLRRSVDDPASLIRQTTADELDGLIADGTIAGGMIPKVASCVRAVRNGVGRAHILDGRIAHVLLLEIFTDSGIGTMIIGDPR